MKKISRSIKKQLLNIAFLLLLIVLTLVVLFKSNSELNFQNIGKFISESNKWLLFAAVCCMFLATACEGFSLYIISRRFGHKCKIGSAMVYSAADIYYSAITPSASGGQPASAYYMVKDGMSVGTASFTLVFNLIAYTAALVILGIIAIFIRPHMLSQFEFFPQFLIIIGLVVQTILLAFFLACLFCHRVVLKAGNGIITFLNKIKLIKNTEKWRTKLLNETTKYSDCLKVIRKHKLLFLEALIVNMGQRVFRVLISCFVCLAADPNAPFWDVFVLQSFLIVGYTSVPLPGGVGVFEYLYLKLYTIAFDSQFIALSMMIVRTITYYLSMIVTGLLTLGYHIYIMRRKPVVAPENNDGADGDGGENVAQSEESGESDGAENPEIREISEDSESADAGMNGKKDYERQ